jgi:cytochrome c-type biogenesis protein CcsB
MSGAEFSLFWITVFAYAVGASLALIGLVFGKARLVAAATVTCSLGLLAHVAAIGARIAFTGHLPVASRYENVLTGSAVVMLFGLLAILRRRGLQPLLVTLAPFALLMLGYALLSQPRYTTMSLVLDNLWMFVHILFAWLAYGAYSVAAALGILYIVRSRKRYEEVPAEERPAVVARLPDPPVLDDLTFRFIILGFLGHVVMVASGSIWARDLWGSYWNWDPVETWSLVSALIYGLWIHLRLTLRWHGRRMAWLAVGSLATVLVAFWGTTILGTTSHSLDDLKLRVPAEAADQATE